MTIPDGFEDLVKIAMKERPGKPKSTGEIWSKFLSAALMGGKRSEPEINFILRMLKQFVEMDYLLKTDGEDWRDNVTALINERLERIKDEDTQTMLREFNKEIFRISASLKGAARFFKNEQITPGRLDELLKDEESTWKFIEDLAANEDVSNVKFTKIILWLHSMGYANDFAPPSYQTKSFVNDVFGYYQFYEDDKYFMAKAKEFAAEVAKKVKGATVRDVSVAIFVYVTLRSMLPQRSKEKKAFTPAVLVKFMKSRKFVLKSITEKLGDFETREALMEDLYKFLGK